MADPWDNDNTQVTPDVYLGVNETPESTGLGFTPGLPTPTPQPIEPTTPSFYQDYADLEQGLIDRTFREDELSAQEQLVLGIGRGQVTPDQLTPKGQETLATYPDPPSFFNRFKQEIGQGFKTTGEGGVAALRQLLGPFSGVLPPEAPVEPGVMGALSHAAQPLKAVTGPLQMMSAPSEAAGESTTRGLGLSKGWELPISLLYGMGTGLGLSKLGRLAKAGAAATAAGATETAPLARGLGAVEGAVATSPLPTASPNLVGVPAVLHPGGVVDTIMATPQYQAAIKPVVEALGKLNLTDDMRRLYLKVEAATSAGLISEIDPALSAFMAHGASESGKVLNRYSQIQKLLKKQAPQLFEEGGPLATIAGASDSNAIVNALRRMSSTRLGLLTTAVATAVRNAVWGLGSHLTLYAMDDALHAFLVGGSKASTTAILENWAAVFRGLTKQGQAELKGLIETFPKEWESFTRGLSLFEAGVPGSKIVRVLNGLNVAQENAVRSIAATARIRSDMLRAGLNPSKDKPTWEMVHGAVKHALEVTMARNPETAAGRYALKLWHDSIVGPLAIPFPRFVFNNALKTVGEFGPWAVLSPRALRTIAHGTPEEAARVASRAVVGTLLLGAAMGVRADPEMSKVPWDKVNGVDINPYNPVNAYFFLAEGILRPPGTPNSQLTGYDAGKALLGIQRIAGTGLALVDILHDHSADGVMKILTEIGKQTIAGVAVPIRSYAKGGVEIAAQLGFGSKEESIKRDTSTGGFFDPTLAQIPYASRTLPPLHTPFRASPLTNDNPTLQYVLGIIANESTPLEKERLRLMIARSPAFSKAGIPQTGLPDVNAAIKKEEGPYAEMVYSLLANSPMWQQASDPVRRLLLDEGLNAAKAEGQAKIFPDLQRKKAWREQSVDLMDAMRKAGIQLPEGAR